MNTKTQNQNKKQNKTKDTSVTFICHCCKNIGKVFVENWNKNDDGPFKIELIQHENKVAMLMDEIHIKDSNGEEVLKYGYCGVCATMLHPPVETEKIKNLPLKPIHKELIQ